MLKQTIILLASVCIVYAAVAFHHLQEKPKKFENVEGCYVQDLDTVIPFGESAPANSSCMEYSCGEPMMQVMTCGLATMTEPPCYLVEDKSKPYPDCCPQIMCD